MTKIQRGNADYWLQAVAEGGEDYYTKPGEAPGEWVGALAAQLGLQGQVDPAGYTAILEGRDPRRGTQLLKRPGTRFRLRPDGSEKRVEPVLGYDVRFSAPKSVSILYALGDEDTRARVRKVLDAAVREGLAHLEREACFVQRGKGGARIEPGQGFIGMAFRHRMSRAGDTALHVHVVVSNLTRAASDGKWLSLASPCGRSPLFLHGKSGGVVFQAALRAGFMREFGLPFEAVTNGYADLRGFERKAIEEMSTRSREIAAWLAERGLEGRTAAQVAAYKTRPAKDHGLDEDRRREEWIERLEPHGVTPMTIAAEVAQATPREPQAIGSEQIDAALSALEETTSHFDRRRLLWALCDQLPEGADGAGIEAAVGLLLASDRVVCVRRAEGPLELDSYTTPRLAELERNFIEGAISGRGAGVAQVTDGVLGAALESHSYLGADQREMVSRLTTGGEQVIAVAALPGTGKTTALEVATQAWERAGIPVIGCATARTATAELKAVGVPSTSIASLLIQTRRRREEGKEPLRPGTVILHDEATMTSTPELWEMRMLAVECAGKLVSIGDPRQIGAIGPGGLYTHYTQTVEPVALTDIRRQRREADRNAVVLLHAGRGSHALDLMRTEGRVIVGESLSATFDGLIGDWHRAYAGGSDAAMIARRRRDVASLNAAARELLREEGALGSAEVIVGEHAFAAGDRVQTRLNREGACNRERWEVLGADGVARTLTLGQVGSAERALTLGPRYLDRRREDGGPSLEHAFALTAYGAQGKTVDRAFVLLEAGSSLEEGLVGLSRTREETFAYAVASEQQLDPDLGSGRRDLSDSLHDARAVLEREANDVPAIELAMRKKVEQMSGAELAKRRAELAAAAWAAGPSGERRRRLARQAEHWQTSIDHLGTETVEMLDGSQEQCSWVKRALRATLERLRRTRRELSSLPERGAEIRPALDPELRLEAALAERRIERLARLDVEAARLEATPVFYEVLGNWPAEDPSKGLAWHRGADALAVYRRRHNVRDRSDPFGPRPRDPADRAERERAWRRIERARRELGLVRDQRLDRAIDHRGDLSRY